MDVGDFLLGGLVIGGGYIAYRWYCDNQAQAAAPRTAEGQAASQMNRSAAKTTNFDPGVLTRKLFGYAPPPPLVPVVQPQSSPQFAAAVAARLAAPIVAQVNRSESTPTPTSPSPSTVRYSQVGLVAPRPTMPDGSGPQPGDPNPLVMVRRMGVLN